MKVIFRDNVKIDYTLSGKGEITLLFIHGAFIDKEYWDTQVAYFKQKYQVVTIDLAGHGKSGKDREDWSAQSFGKDVATVIKELDLSDVILIGHSIGGDVILETSNIVPDRVIGLVGIDNFKNAGTSMPEEVQKQIEQALEYMKVDFPSVCKNIRRSVPVIITKSVPVQR